jgi:hypothetical protein
LSIVIIMLNDSLLALFICGAIVRRGTVSWQLDFSTVCGLRFIQLSKRK